MTLVPDDFAPAAGALRCRLSGPAHSGARPKNFREPFSNWRLSPQVRFTPARQAWTGPL